MLSGNRKLTITQRLVLGGILVLLVLVATFPFYWILLTSLKSGRAVYDTSQVLLAQGLTLTNYQLLFKETEILHWIWFTSLVATVATVISLIIGVLAAYSVTNFRYRGQKAVTFAVFLSYVIPQSILFIPLYFILNQMRLVNQFPGLVLAYLTFCVPFCTWLLMSYFRTIPVELGEAALIDGCRLFGVLWRIILPLTGPGVVTAAIFFSPIVGMNFYMRQLWRRPMICGPCRWARRFLTSDVFIWGQMMAAAIVSTIPMLIIFILLQRYVVQGLTLGGVKDRKASPVIPHFSDCCSCRKQYETQRAIPHSPGKETTRSVPMFDFLFQQPLL